MTKREVKDKEKRHREIDEDGKGTKQTKEDRENKE